MKPIIYAALLAFYLSITGCNAYDRTKVGFWDQRVAFTAWGFTMATEFGPFNIGYLQWNRNVTPLTPASPADVLSPLKPKATIP